MAKIKKFFDNLESENYNSINVVDIKNKFFSSLKSLIDGITQQVITIL